MRCYATESVLWVQGVQRQALSERGTVLSTAGLRDICCPALPSPTKSGVGRTLEMASRLAAFLSRYKSAVTSLGRTLEMASRLAAFLSRYKSAVTSLGRSVGHVATNSGLVL
jgi:hypothetical protein